jgi:uncharacterized protein (TIGR01244 family)
MEAKARTAGLSARAHITPTDMKAIRDAGFHAIICTRPDGEGADQSTYREIAQAAQTVGLKAPYLRNVCGTVMDEDAAASDKSVTELPDPVLACCRTGTRPATLWSLAQAGKRSLARIPAATQAAGHDMGGVVRRIVNRGKTPTDTGDARCEGVSVGAAVAAFQPEDNAIIPDVRRVEKYKRLIVCPEIKLDWNKGEGLVETRHHGSATSNHRDDLAPYTAQRVGQMKQGRAILRDGLTWPNPTPQSSGPRRCST